MSLKYTKIPTDTFETLQVNGGMLVETFVPATGVYTNQLGAISGGISFTAQPSFVDYGEDIDNCPKNTKELMMLDDWTITVSGTYKTIKKDTIVRNIGLADIDSTDTTKIVPRNEIDLENDFHDLWILGDYGREGGFVAVHLMDAMSTGGFQWQTTDKGKGDFAFEYTAHYSIDAQDTVPFEVYLVDSE